MGFSCKFSLRFHLYPSSTTSNTATTHSTLRNSRGVGSGGTFPTRHPRRHCRAHGKESCPCQGECEWPCLYTAPPQSYGRESIFPEFPQRSRALARYCRTLWAAMRRADFLSHTTVIFTDHFTLPLPFKCRCMLTHTCSHYWKTQNLAGSPDKLLVF